MHKFFSYARVSTTRQGEQGVSLQQQKEAIVRYAAARGLNIIERFEEQETAAKRGRPVFSKMIRSLKTGKASGVIMHKIDRSARNLKDWADLGELIDSGIEVHFANESLDLHSRGGRLSADIQAVVAADYIRNLREETKKGFYGRLKQGVLPMPAPVGYLNVGPGKPKAIDPTKAPLVQQAFELYATGKFNIELLVEEMYCRGLRSKSGRKVTRSEMSRLLNRRFYAGLIEIRKTGQTFVGRHQALISLGLFDTVQEILKGRFGRRTQKNRLLYSRLVKCKYCNKSLIGEVKKKHIYYRCHTKSCPTVNIAEQSLNEHVAALFSPLQFTDEEKRAFTEHISEIAKNWDREKQSVEQALKLRLENIQAKLQKVTDAYFDDLIDKAAFERRKAALELERKEVVAAMTNPQREISSAIKNLAEFIELAGSAYLLYENANLEEKRQLLRLITSNRIVDCKTPMFMLHPLFQAVADREKNSDGSPSCAIHRRVVQFINKIEPLLSKMLQELESALDESREPLIDSFHSLALQATLLH